MYIFSIQKVFIPFLLLMCNVTLKQTFPFSLCCLYKPVDDVDEVV